MSTRLLLLESTVSNHIILTLARSPLWSKPNGGAPSLVSSIVVLGVSQFLINDVSHPQIRVLEILLDTVVVMLLLFLFL